MSSRPAQLLLQREFQNLKRYPVSTDYYIHDLNNGSIFQWIVYLFGPVGSMFEGATFKALMRFPESFPHEPPSVQILSEVYHPNVFRDGKICISTLQLPAPDATSEDASMNWSAALGVTGALQSVVSLLADPNPYDPANPDSAAIYLKNRVEFNRKAREVSRKSLKDLPKDFIRPILTAPASMMREESAAKIQRQSQFGEDDTDYQYDTDDQLEMEAFGDD